MVKTVIFLVHGHKIETGLLIVEVEKRLADPDTKDGSVTIDEVRQEHDGTSITKGAYARFNPKNVVGLVALQ